MTLRLSCPLYAGRRDSWISQQGMSARKRLGIEGINSGCKKMPILECIIQREEIHHLPAPGVDHDGTLWEDGQLVRANHVAGFGCQFRHQHQDLAHAKHGLKVGYHFYSGKSCKARVDIRIIAQHATVESIPELACDFRAYVCNTNNPDGLPLKLRYLQARARRRGGAISYAPVAPHQLLAVAKIIAIKVRAGTRPKP